MDMLKTMTGLVFAPFGYPHPVQGRSKICIECQGRNTNHSCYEYDTYTSVY